MRHFLSLFLLLALAIPSNAVRADPIPFSAVMTSAAAPIRRALVVVPSIANDMNLRGALAASDANAYRDTLRLLGFSGAVVAAETRQGLRDAARAFAASVPRDSEVVVFVLGSIVPAGGRLYVPASDLSSADRTAERIASAAIDLSEILHDVAERGPKDVVVLVDECGNGESKPSCDIATSTFPDGISAIVVHRIPSGTDGPVAGIATVRQDLLPLMREPSLDYLQLYGRLNAKLQGTNDSLTATAALSRSFAFLPGEFLAKLPIECNRVDPAADADALRRAPSVGPLVPACERAATTYDFSPYFKTKLAAAREQFAFQKAVTNCAGNAEASYLEAYPNGAYRFAVDEHQSRCERERQPTAPPPAPPEPEPAPPSLQAQAFAAVTTYYERHSYNAGDDMSGLLALYPPVFSKREGNVTRNQHIAELARFYARYASFNFQVVAGSLDYSGCDGADSCLMRGTAQVTSQKVGDPGGRVSRLQFSLRFDLRGGAKVLYECAVVLQRVSREAPCD